VLLLPTNLKTGPGGRCLGRRFCVKFQFPPDWRQSSLRRIPSSRWLIQCSKSSSDSFLLRQSFFIAVALIRLLIQ